MKNFYIFGGVAITSFLSCFLFLSSPDLLNHATAVSFKPTNHLVNHLTSSVSLLQPTSPVSDSINSATTTLTPIIDSTTIPYKDLAKTPPTVDIDLPQTIKPVPQTSSLLVAPIVDTKDLLTEVDSSYEASAIRLPESPKPSKPAAIISRQAEKGMDYSSIALLDAYATALADFALRYNYSEEYAFLLNMGMKSGKKRFFVINLSSGKVLTTGLVAHGQGRKSFNLDKQYSNKPGSGCSSLGIYKVGSSYYGGYGKSFRLTGLEKSNSNALRRSIVLHGMNCIPDQEINYPICQSEGCPSLSPAFLEEISTYIKSSKKPILLWMFDPSINTSKSLQ